MASQQLQIQDIGELGLLQRLHRYCDVAVVGDDAAILQVTPGHSLVVTTDVLVDGVHFSDRTTSPADAGWRAAAANLSDLAAMGASPLGITVGLSLPPELPVAWVEELYQGLTACLGCHNTPIVGGDITRSPVTTVAITALGQVVPEQAIYRHTAQPGDAILVTGVHGASRAGLELLLHPTWGIELSESVCQQLIQAHQRPQPRLDVISHLRRLYPCSRVTGMDSSDGLANAVIQICQASGVGAKLWRDRIPYPISGEIPATSCKDQLIEWALYGGEDFELVLCLEPTIAKRLQNSLGKTTEIVGEIQTESTILLVESTDFTQPRSLDLSSGFQHFSRP